MAQNSKRANSSATSRLKQDYLRLKRDPVPYIVAEPLPSNILQWHYVVKGPENSLYEGGYYHGKLVFPREFPFKPPSIYMITPSGRFVINSRLCLSISDFHPDTWNPAWSVATILTGLLSFMLEKSPTLGSIETSDYVVCCFFIYFNPNYALGRRTHSKRQLASQSGTFNLNDTTFCELFPDIVEEIREGIRRREAELENAQQGSAALSCTTRSAGNAVGGTNVGGGQGVGGNGGGGGGFLQGALTNIVVILGFAAFAYTVKHIIMNMMEN